MSDRESSRAEDLSEVNPYAAPASTGPERVVSLELDEGKLSARIRWARGVFALSALLALPTMLHDPWRSLGSVGFIVGALWISLRVQLLALLLGFSFLVSSWTVTFATPLAREDARSLLVSRLDEPIVRTLAMDLSIGLGVSLACAVILWRGIAAATTLSAGERAWLHLRTALGVVVVMTVVASFALLSDGKRSYYAGAVQLAGIVICLPSVWLAAGQWRGLFTWSNVRPQDGLFAFGTLLGLVAIQQEYLWFAEKVAGIRGLQTLGWQLSEQWSTELLLAFFAGVVPLVEEVVFRGFVQARLERVMTPGAALLAQAALYSAAHPTARVWLCHAVVGFALGWLRNRTRSLYAPFLVHAGYNAWLVVSELGHLPEFSRFG